MRTSVFDAHAQQCGHQATNALGVTITDRSCLIMDEVDGMSAGDRGGVGALNALIKKTKVCRLVSKGTATHVVPDSHHLYSQRCWRAKAETSQGEYI